MRIVIPTGVLEDLPLLELVNVAAVWAGMLLILWSAWKSFMSSNLSARPGEGQVGTKRG